MVINKNHALGSKGSRAKERCLRWDLELWGRLSFTIYKDSSSLYSENQLHNLPGLNALLAFLLTRIISSYPVPQARMRDLPCGLSATWGQRLHQSLHFVSPDSAWCQFKFNCWMNEWIYLSIHGIIVLKLTCSWDFPCGPVVKIPPSNIGHPGLILGWGLRSHMLCSMAKITFFFDLIFSHSSSMILYSPKLLVAWRISHVLTDDGW